MHRVLKASPQDFTYWLRIRPIVCACAALALASCAPSGTGDGQSAFESTLSMVSQNVAPILKEISPELGGLVERLDTSPEKQIQMAAAGAKEVEQEHPRVKDPKLETYLTQMARKLAHGQGTQHWDYEVAVIEDDQLNAFTVGAGQIYVTTGLVAALDDEAQMAMVLGHEIGHITEGHVVSALRDKTMIALAGAAGEGMIGGSAAGGPGDREWLMLIGRIAITAGINGYGRQQEEDADKIGLGYMVEAGYDPQQAPTVFEVFLERYGDQPALVNFLHGDHPTSELRIQMLKRMVAANYAAQGGAGTVNTPTYKKLVTKYKG